MTPASIPPVRRTVTLVDEHNRALGEAEIVDAHTGEGKLHRAFSVYVFRKNGTEFLMQQRSPHKMLWAGIWANTCCSHPFENEDAMAAGTRRLREELGFEAPLRIAGEFVYRAEDPSGKGVEHEHVTILRADVDDADVRPNPAEVADWKWIAVDKLRRDMATHPDRYAPWFHQGLALLLRSHA